MAPFSNSEANTLLDIMERRTARMKPNASQTIRMEQMLDYNLAWQSIKLSAQFAQEKKSLGMLVPNEEAIIKEFIDTCNNLGVALKPAGQTTDGKQQMLQFSESDMTEETKQAIKEEKKVVERPVPELNPEKWENDKSAKDGLVYQLCAKGNTGNNLLAALTMFKLFRKKQEEDPVKKGLWDKIEIGALLKDMFQFLGNKGVTTLLGLGRCVCNSLRVDGSPVYAHCTVRRNIPSLSDEDAVSVVKALIEICNPTETPVDQLPEIMKGIVAPTRDLFLKLPAPVTDAEHRIFGRFCNIYRDALGKTTEPNYSLKATNMMINITNMYRDKEAQLLPYTESEYPKATAEEKAEEDKK